MAYILILFVVLLASPVVLMVASSQKRKTKQKVRVFYLLLLAFIVFLGFFNWENFLKDGRSGFELAASYPQSFLWLFFATAMVQFVLTVSSHAKLYFLSVVLNFMNTILFFISIMFVSRLLGRQVISFANIAVIFLVLIGNIVGLVLINKDKKILSKYFYV